LTNSVNLLHCKVIELTREAPNLFLEFNFQSFVRSWKGDYPPYFALVSWAHSILNFQERMPLRAKLWKLFLIYLRKTAELCRLFFHAKY